MGQALIERGPASRRTLILCLILGLSVAVHRAIIGFGPSSADAGEELASLTDARTPSGMPPPTGAPQGPVTPQKPGAAPAPSGPAAPDAPQPRLNPYARRLWVLDPFRAPNVLRLGGGDVDENARPLLDGPATKEMLARSAVEQEKLPDGTTHLSITMPGAGVPAPTVKAPTAKAPAGPARLAQGPSRPERRPVPARRAQAAAPRPLAPSVFAFAGFDLSREEGRRWTLALAFEGRGY